MAQEKTETLLRITSPAFQFEGMIPLKYTCDGEDISPPIDIEGIPKETKSLALIMDDPDAPFGTWDHWLLWNIDPKTTRIPEENVPNGAVSGKNSFKKLEYGGPCPPYGTHRYFFRVYALDTRLPLSEGSGKGQLQKAMENHILAEGALMGRYHRK